MTTPEFHANSSITNHSRLIYDKKRRACRLRFKHFRNLNLLLVKIDTAYSRYMGYNDPGEMLRAAGHPELIRETGLYLDPLTSKVYKIEADRIPSAEQLQGFELYPLLPHPITLKP